MDSSEFQFQFIHLNSIESTNIYAHQLIQTKNVSEGLVVTTNFQEKGKGQRSQKWESDDGKNLLMSILLQPELKLSQQFDWNKMIALSVKEALDSLTVGKTQVKWPNDILVEGEKIAGILVENSIKGDSISDSIIGIGINVNQTEFETYTRAATSIKLRTGSHFSLEELRDRVLMHLKENYLQFDQETVRKDYLESLYGYGTPLKFRDKEGVFTGVILGISPNGRLQLNKKGKLKDYEVKEISFLD